MPKFEILPRKTCYFMYCIPNPLACEDDTLARFHNPTIQLPNKPLILLCGLLGSSVINKMYEDKNVKR